MQKSLVVAAALSLWGASLSWAQEAPPAERTLAVSAFEREVLARYRASDRAGAERLLAARAGAARFDQAQGFVVRAVFASRAAGLTIRVERSEARESLVVALPPGVLGRARVTPRPGESLEPPQDLLLLRPALLSLAPGERSAEVTLPVACAAFRRQGPEPGVSYALERLKPGSKLDRLAQALCARESVPPSLDPALALAIWIAHEDLGYRRLADSSLGFRTFRTPRQRVGAEQGPAAAALLHEAGLDLRAFDFYRAGGPAARGPVPLAPVQGEASAKDEKPSPQASPASEAQVRP